MNNYPQVRNSINKKQQLCFPGKKSHLCSFPGRPVISSWMNKVPPRDAAASVHHPPFTPTHATQQSREEPAGEGTWHLSSYQGHLWEWQGMHCCNWSLHKNNRYKQGLPLGSGMLSHSWSGLESPLVWQQWCARGQGVILSVTVFPYQKWLHFLCLLNTNYQRVW